MDIYGKCAIIFILTVILGFWILEDKYKKANEKSFHVAGRKHFYPYKVIQINISGRKNVDYKSEIENYLCRKGIAEFNEHFGQVNIWKNTIEQEISRSSHKEKKIKEYFDILDDSNMFQFAFIRHRVNGSYYEYVYSCDIARVRYIYKQLETTGYQCSLKEWEEKNQRKLMTPKLREEIMRRDRYTCKYCGKYMPNGKDIHIDHIIPISKGGKTVPNNLQVLCSKCNLSKHNKIM